MGSIERIVVVRHGEGEGDVRRANHKKGLYTLPDKPTIQEKLTQKGREQARATGLYIRENLLVVNGLAAGFDLFVVAPSPRTRQTAEELNMGLEPQVDERLNELNRGLIKGWWPEKHQEEYPESYEQMIRDPLHWIPPGAQESKSSMAHGRVAETVEEWEQKGLRHILVVGHRDWEHALLIHFFGEEIAARVDTEPIRPASLMTIEPKQPDEAGSSPDISVRLVCPWDNQQEMDLLQGALSGSYR